MQKKYLENHMKNLSNAIGHDVRSYHYIIDGDDLTRTWVQMHNDLNYPLKVDSKYRRVIVYNKQGLENQIIQMINTVIAQNLKALADIVANDIVNSISLQLNGITTMSHNKVPTSKSYSWSKVITRAISGGLVNGFFKILEDMTEDDY